MGYYTNFSLDGVSGIDVDDLIFPESLGNYHKDFFKYGELVDAKWYSHIHDLIEVSKLNPEAYIYTSGIGEENGDQWEAVFHNGKYKKSNAVITFKPFSELVWEDK